MEHGLHRPIWTLLRRLQEQSHKDSKGIRSMVSECAQIRRRVDELNLIYCSYICKNCSHIRHNNVLHMSKLKLNEWYNDEIGRKAGWRHGLMCLLNTPFSALEIDFRLAEIWNDRSTLREVFIEILPRIVVLREQTRERIRELSKMNLPE